MREWGPLGEVLGRSAQNAVNVERATDEAAALLKTVRDTFPAYTLHDEQHALNVVRHMGDLALPRIGELQPLEAALLILSAYFHDIGMVYSAADRAAIPDEPEFRAFLRRDAEAFLAVRRNGGEPPAEVLDRYRRLRHADRVRMHLDRLDRREPGMLRWDHMSLVSILAKLCASHVLPAADIPATFDRFLTVADTRFCAMLLRLADIMDFDHTRTPRAIHDHLYAGTTRTASLAESDRHWQQHLASGGFSFPAVPPGERHDRYTIDYAANPADPGIEHDIRVSLAAVAAEFEACRPVRDVCRRWRDLPLPGKIDDAGIDSIGYTYGDFFFSLDRSAVLELFTGKELYEDPHAFLRELLQNAIDAVQTRIALHGDDPGDPPTVDVTCWDGDDGFLWIRIDDDGIGMDERQIREYFLRVGRSYYTSAEFQAELLRDDDRAAFAPISRFGIGVLSCFMAGDRVEVSTRRLLGNRYDQRADTALRLSLHRDRDYFVLRKEGEGRADMPGPRGNEDFRSRPGTSIAVRIDPNRTGIERQELVDKVHEYVFAPPVRVTVQGRPASARPLEDIRRPLLARTAVVHLRTDNRTSPDDVLPYLGGLRLAVVPLDLSSTTAVTSVAGQLLALVGVPSDADFDVSRELFAGWPAGDLGASRADVLERIDFDLFWTNEKGEGPKDDEDLFLNVKVWRFFDAERLTGLKAALPATDPEPVRRIAGTEAERVAVLLASPSALRAALDRMTAEEGLFRTSFTFSGEETGLAGLQELIRPYADGPGWAHGGIVLPNERVLFPSGAQSHPAFVGMISLTGRLRPDVTVSRDAIRAVPVAVHSAVHLAVRKATAGLDAPREALEQIRTTSLITAGPGELCSSASIGDERLVASGAWNDEPVIPTGDGAASVDDIRATVAAGRRVALMVPGPTLWEGGQGFGFAFYDHLALGLIDLLFEVTFERVDETAGSLYAVSSRESGDVSKYLPALFAVPFADATGIARAPLHRAESGELTGFSSAFLNASHPLAQWIADNAAALARDFAAPFNRVLRRAPWITDPEDVNEALRRVADARTHIPAPPAAAYVREDENGWWVSR